MKKLLLVVLLAAGLTSCNEQKTAYVDTSKLIQEYKEMKEVEAEFTAKSDSIKGELDTMAQDFQREVEDYQSNMNSMSVDKRKEVEQTLMRKQQMIQQQQQMRGNQLREESDTVIDSIVSKVKGYVKDYGKDNGYTYIFGSNESANIMYAKDGLDITEEILEKLNAEYKK
ncbi:periplasmic chaperone for outer membrane proteins Skp [Gillisia sp. Hel1_33_143]|uniref:OmpH family outer membrane protein n=1 Tax=Gillisia sp. Hel1_33_143 TaxID=1336796 RepID=UPI00087CD1B9|nr:OmpH family outer membrane protein [Gillisia sp. Hel1_33_143]SDR85499.1 periplasmic chaperone for outer membrane proteins Skp [Gillisia sp. Hel1_33_143]